PPWPFRVKLSLILSTVSVAGTLLFAFLSYQADKTRMLSDIDDTLCAAAVGAHSLVAPIIIAEAEVTPRTEPEYTTVYRYVQNELEEYVQRARLKFVWVIAARPDGTAYELVSNLSDEQIAAKADPMEALLLNPYELPPVYAEAVKTGQRQTGSAEDSYGSFRSCIVPYKQKNGQTVLFGADLEISAVNQRLREGITTSIAIGFFVLGVTLLVIGLVSRNIAGELRVAESEADAVRRLVFADTGKSLRSTTKEIDRLFRSMMDMKSGLRAFGKYVPTTVVSQVIASGKAEVGGERRELSLLMTDVTDFTTISEQLQPERVMIVMSEYFDRVVAPILAANGTLDKYVGDAIFAYWNAPALQPGHPVMCCRAALAARDASRKLAAEWQRDGRWAWHTRFGLHCGATVFGNVGARDRLDFTVIGSSVNLASRIEGLNKYYKTEILASSRLRDLADAEMAFRRVDYVLPKGAIEPFEIFELIGERATVMADGVWAGFLKRWDEAQALYKQRRWAEALAQFSALSAERPDDNVAKIYVDRCQSFVAAPPPPDWDGIRLFDSK
ncbi:MAG: adenylate/guanylate cyclase domain-containing protein, partial [Rhodospirillaceae bacterium]|nr:adenylate/guanylate cyclase domain-containing protein [Rhodospirillaceae bacterium]